MCDRAICIFILKKYEKSFKPDETIKATINFDVHLVYKGVEVIFK